MKVADAIFLIYGEDQNDQNALKYLIAAILERPSVNASIRRSPIILSRGAVRKRVPMAQEIASFWRQEVARKGKNVVVVAHRDCDDVEPAHLNESIILERDIKAAGVTSVVAVTPAWEIESWWMLFPAAVAKARGCWRKIDYGNRNIGFISNAKETLTRDLRPLSKAEQQRCRDFAEVDGVTIASHILKLDLLKTDRKSKSDSFDHFCSALTSAVGAAKR